jgi:hypothetical protein
VTKRKPTKLEASVIARLSKLALERRDDFQLVLLRYANERLLYRLSQSPNTARSMSALATPSRRRRQSSTLLFCSTSLLPDCVGIT